MNDANEDRKSIRVLIVSDDPLIRQEARFGFPSHVAVSFANDSRDAAPMLAQQEPSVVVVDMQTGKAGGFALVTDMTQSGRLARLPVLILLERPHDAWLAKQCGATAWVTKPLGSGRLASLVLALLA